MEIQLTQGKTAIFDDEDKDLIVNNKWYTKNNSGFFYAVRTDRSVKPRRTVFMHRLVLGVTDPKVFVDHINHNTLDNRKCNLRACSHAENMQNGIKTKKNKTSQYKGVSFRVQRRNGVVVHTGWLSQIGYQGKTVYAKLFKCEKEAALAYDKIAPKYFGEFASLNFPQTI